MVTHLLSSLSPFIRALSCGLMLLMTALTAVAGDTTVLTWNQPTTLTYGTQISVAATASTNGGAPIAGSYAYDPALGTVLPAGNTHATVTFMPAAGGKKATTGINIRVNPATLTVTSHATKVHGMEVPALAPTYGGFVNGETAGSVLSGAPSLSTIVTASSAVGNYPITVGKGSLKSDKNYDLVYVAGNLAVVPASATVTLSGLIATYDGAGHGAIVSTTPAGLATSVTYNGSAQLPVNAGSYAVVATITDPNYTGSATGTLVINRALATVTLSGLAHTYDGNPHGATSTTVPSGLPVIRTYDGNPVMPVNAGSYAVNAFVAHPNYTGTGTGTLTIAKANAVVTLGGLAHTYDGNPHAALVATVPAGLSVVVSYDASGTAPVDAGSYEVVASVLNPNYLGSASDTLTIARVAAEVELADLIHTYDGAAHPAVVTTLPAGLATAITYDGGSAVPVTAGTYVVTATIADDNYLGSAATGLLVINQASQTIAFAPLVDTSLGVADQHLSATATSGLALTFSVSGPAEIIAGALHVIGPGTVTVTATQDGDANWQAAPASNQSITVSAGGLVASYFANESLSGTPVLSRTDYLVDFDWANGSPGAGVPADSFSVRWDGEIETRFNEAYTLTFRTDDGVRVWLDGQLVVNQWNERSAGDSTFTFNAQAGRHYRMRMEYFEHLGDAVAMLRWSSASEPSGPIPSSQLHPVAPEATAPVGTGTGLTASYFTNETLAGVPAVSRVDAGVDFNWGSGSPASGIPSDSFSARWTGDLETRYTEPYTLILRSDDGVRVWLDGQLVIDDWILRGPANSLYTFNAEAGRRYRINIEYFEHFGSAVAHLQWFSAREYFGAIPASQLYPLPTPVVEIDDHLLTVAEGEAITLNGSVDNTGATAMTYAWTQVSGPAPATLASADQTSTVARFPLAGDYVMKLWAFNGHVVVSDTTTVTVLAPDVSSDLVAYYAFDETDGPLVLDASGHHHTGTLAGPTRTLGKSRGALRFDGASYVWALNNEDLDAPIQALTLATWLKPDTALSQMAHPWPMPIYRAQYEDSSGYALMVTLTETDQFGLRLHHQAGLGQVVEANTSSPLVPNAWVHAAGVYDGATAKLYLNGVLVQSVGTGPITLRNAPYSPLYLGYGFEGAMDEVRIYHRALSRIDLYGLAQGGSDRRMPAVDAGPDQVVTLGAPTTTFAGSATDDGSSGATLVPRWKQIAGPATATVSNSQVFAPQVTFPAVGTYRFQLEVSDGVLIGRDELRVEVTDGSVDLVSGLILHYRADEGSGTLVADASGKGHDGTYLGNPQWSADGQVLGALALDGASVVQTPSASDLSNPTQLTLSVWLRANSPLVDMVHPYPFVLDHSDYATNRGFALMTVLSDSNTFGFRLHTGSGRREVTMDGLPSGSWVHVVATFDGQTMRLFRNGVLIDVNTTGPIPLPALDVPLRVGEGFEGMMDDVRIYDRALSPTEVQSLHASAPLSASG